MSLLASQASAHCPVCVVATGSAVVAARIYGVDDLIVGTFAGGFLVSTAYWVNNVLLKRNRKKAYFPWQLEVLILGTFLSSLLTFQFAGFLGDWVYQIYGVDKLVIGTAVGSFMVVAAFAVHARLRKLNRNRNYVPFQAILLALAFMAVAAVGFYLAEVL